tara:strand:+ start:2566 stop:3669 length:1104 start_codon:yes stop_codon:yes gene_type:complete
MLTKLNNIHHMSSRIPVTVITGFLGSGKTTLLRHLLITSNARLAVLINEFGSVGLDGDLIKSCGFCKDQELPGRIVELNNGCLCCTVQEDFLPTMQGLLSKSKDLEGIIVETSGLALPKPLLLALNWPEIRSNVYINAVITLVDGEALREGSPVGDLKALQKQREDDPNIDHMTSVDDLFKDQLREADLVLVSRSDKISSMEMEIIREEIKSQVNCKTPILPISNGVISSEMILGLKNPIRDEVLLFETSENPSDHHHHDHLDVSSFSLRLECDLNKDFIERALLLIVEKYPILRIKGRCWLTGKTIPLQIQMVGKRLTSWFESVPINSWRPNSTGIDLVVIALNPIGREDIEAIFKEKTLPNKENL